MNKVTILSFLLLTASYDIYSNNPPLAERTRLARLEFIAIYDKHWQADSMDVNSIREEPMILLFGGNQSKFYSFNSHLVVDSILPGYPVHKWNYITASRRYPSTINFYKVFKNHSDNIIEFYDRIGLDLFRHSGAMNIFRWHILHDMQQMFGYSVQKATTSFAGRDWVAWFAPEISISDGPYKFNGLPGLILLLHDTRNHYRFELTQFTKNESERFLEKSELSYFTSTRARMIEMRRQFIQNPFGFLPNVTHHGGEAQRQEVLERIRRRNNMLELRY